MPPRKKIETNSPQPVRYFVRSRFSNELRWVEATSPAELTPHVEVVLVGYDDGSVKWL